MYRIALEMLMGDRARYIMLVSALAFATVLMAQQSAVFVGLMDWTTAVIKNTNSEIWVTDPKVEQVNDVKPMRDTDLGRVRSVSGVLYATPFYFGIQQARLYDGRFKSVLLLGLDNATLIGAPPIMLEGSLDALREDRAVIIDEIGIRKLTHGENPLKIGDLFDINDHEVKIVGICKADPAFFGYPYVYTTYDRALEIAPKVRRNLSFVLVKRQPDITTEELTKRIHDQTGLQALTENQFYWKTVWWFFKNTNIPASFGVTIMLGLFVGTAVAGQTFYTFVLENLGNLGALKAMGADNKLLRRMLFVQAFVVGLVGYGIGIGLAALFGLIMKLVRGEDFPFFMIYQIPLMVLFLILLICFFSAYLGIRKISKLEPNEVFRG